MYRARRPAALLAFVSLLLTPALAGATPSAGLIETYAGGHAQDGLSGAESHFWQMGGVGVGRSGRIYVAETGYVNMGSLRVRMWDPATQKARTVAGSGVGGSENVHDGEPATTIGMGARTISLDPQGNLFVFESGGLSSGIRRVDAATGLASTIHKNLFLPPEGPMDVDRSGRVYFGTYSTVERWDPVTGQVTRIAGGGGTGTSLLDDQPATSVQIGQPQDIEVDDGGNVYFSESTRIRWIDPQGFIHTLAGGRQAQLTEDGQYGFLSLVGSGQHEVLARPDGSIWYTDGVRVRRIAPQQEFYALPGSRRVTTVFRIEGGFADGPLTSALFGSIVDWEGMPDGGFVLSDGANRRVRVVSPAGEVRTVMGNGLSTKFRDPGPDVYDWTGDGGPATSGQVLAPCAVALAPDGDLIFTEREAHHKVRRVDAETGAISTVAGGDGQGYEGDGGPASEAALDYPCGVAVAPDGDVLIVDTGNHVVRKVEADTGVITTVVGNGTQGGGGDGGPAAAAQLQVPLMIAIDDAGRIYVSDPGDQRVRVVDTEGVIRTFAGNGTLGFGGDGGPATAAQLRSPRGLALLPDGSVLIADSDNNLIRKVGPDGRIRTIAGTGDEGFSGDGGPWLDAEFDTPNGLAYDPATGAVYVADTLNQVIRRLDPDGIVRRVAGNGELSYCGDGWALAAEACLRNPQGLVVTPQGDLLFADFSNLRIRRIADARSYPGSEDEIVVTGLSEPSLDHGILEL